MQAMWDMSQMQEHFDGLLSCQKGFAYALALLQLHHGGPKHYLNTSNARVKVQQKRPRGEPAIARHILQTLCSAVDACPACSSTPHAAHHPLQTRMYTRTAWNWQGCTLSL